jgi:nucleotide-binding universal stress UspA family protein
MTIVLVVVVVVLAALLAVQWVRTRGPRPQPIATPSAARILLPFDATALAPRALDAALRLARAEQATLVPVFLARVALRLPLEAPLPRQSAVAINLQEAIEQRAAVFGIAVDARIERGRTLRHALRQTIEHERYDRLVIAAAHHGQPGLHAEDVAWLLDHAPGEILVLRPAPAGGPAAAGFAVQPAPHDALAV